MPIGKKSIVFACLLLVQAAASGGELPKWEAGGPLLTRDGKPVFLAGVNYVPPVQWHTSWAEWNPEAMRRDLASLKSIGAKCARVFPLWPLLQPTPDRLDPLVLDRFVTFLGMAEEAGVAVQPSPVTGWMSGFTFLPDWATGNVFTDPGILEGQKVLARSLAGACRRHPAVFSYDFGNELNVLVDVMRLSVSPEQADRWMRGIYAAFKQGDPDRPVTNGIGTGFDERFNVRAIAASSDFLSVHSYPIFHRTLMLDPQIGQRSTYSVNYIIEWAATQGKPVLMQETGATEYSDTPADIARYLRVTYSGSWAEGAAGYFWWCSHDIRPDYAISVPSLRLEFSNSGQEDRKPTAFEQGLGLLTADNREKPAAAEFRRLVRTFDALGNGWTDRRPAVYLLSPDHDEYFRTMIDLITPFTLLKQVHADVRFLRDGLPVPPDARAVVVPCRAVSDRGKAEIRKYLEAGGTVYQSGYNDFADSVRFTGPASDPAPRLAYIDRRAGRFGSSSADRFIRLPAVSVRGLSVGRGVETLMVLCTGEERPTDWEFGIPLMVRQPVGKGQAFVIAADIENALGRVYDPWREDASNRIYGLFVPEGQADVDNKFVELFLKERGSERIAVLINRSGEYQDVLFRGPEPAGAIVLADAAPRNPQPGRAFRMQPCEVRVLRLR